MRLVALLVAGLLSGHALGCASERSSPECKEVCRKEARCMDQKGEAVAAAAAATSTDQNKFDQSECIAACTALQRDREGARQVSQHMACVDRAKEDCAALLICP